jgi:hypothetical protein
VVLGAGALEADAPVEPVLAADGAVTPAPPLGLPAWRTGLGWVGRGERLCLARGLALGEHFCGLACLAWAGAGWALVVERGGGQVGVTLAGAGAGVVVVGVVFVCGVVVVTGGAVVAVGVVVAGEVAVAVGVVAVAEVVVTGVVVVGAGARCVVVVVVVGADAGCVVVLVLVASVGAALEDWAPRAAVPAPIQPFTAPEMASVLASSDSRERQPVRALWVASLRCI